MSTEEAIAGPDGEDGDLTAEQATQLGLRLLQLRDFGSELDALVARYRTVGEGRPGARRVHLGYVATPVELDPPTEA